MNFKAAQKATVVNQILFVWNINQRNIFFINFFKNTLEHTVNELPVNLQTLWIFSLLFIIFMVHDCEAR